MKILIISFSHLDRDPRVYRQIEHFVGSHQVYTAGLSDSGLPVKKHYKLSVKPVKTIWDKIVRAIRYKLVSFERTYWLYHKNNSMSYIEDEKIDVIIANDFQTMPLVDYYRGNAKVVLDAHEYTPRQLEHIWNWRFFEQPYQKYIVRSYIKKTDAFLTVSPGIAEEYFKNYGVKAVVITNAAPYRDFEVKKTDEIIKFIYHGFANRGRKIEELIDVFSKVNSSCELHLMLVGSKKYIHRLKQRAKNSQNIVFHEPVPMQEIIEEVHKYDVGLSYFTPVTFNLLHALPNKFFEYIQARLAVLTGPTPSMSTYVKDYNIGRITKSFSQEALLKTINSFTHEDIDEYKKNCEVAAKILNKKENMKLLNHLITEEIWTR